MGINRLIKFSFLLVAIVSMAGIAEAQCTDPLNCDTMALWNSAGTTALGPGYSLQLVPNGPAVPVILRVTFAVDRLPPNSTHELAYRVDVLTDPDGTASDSDITLHALELTCPDPFMPCAEAPGFPLVWMQDGGAGAIEDIRIEVSSAGPKGATYNIILEDLSYGPPISFQTTNIDATNIPEFPTIAAPIIATIGMLLFLQRRKQDKDSK